MKREEAINYWIEVAEYDLETAKAMLETGRLLYVGFMCHQAIEKILKARYVSAENEIPPYTHNLVFLAEEGGLFGLFSNEQIELIQLIRPLNVESRYPNYKNKKFKTLSYEKCKELLSGTEDIFKWIKAKL